FRLPPLIGFVQGGGQLFPLVLGGGQAVLHLLQARARLGQGILDLGEAARGQRRLGQGLIERRLQGGLFVLQKRQFCARQVVVRFRSDNPLPRRVGAFLQQPLLVAQRPAVAGLFAQLLFEIGQGN